MENIYSKLFWFYILAQIYDTGSAVTVFVVLVGGLGFDVYIYGKQAYNKKCA